MSDPTKREWRFYLDDMIGFAEKVTTYTEGMDQDHFVSSGLNYDATVRNLELLGEAATHIPDVATLPGEQAESRGHISPVAFVDG